MYTYRPGLTFYELGGGIGDFIQVTTVAQNFNTGGGLTFPSNIPLNNIERCFIDLCCNYQNTDAGGNTNHIESGYLRLADNTVPKYHTGISDLKYAMSSRSQGTYSQQRIYGDTEIEGSWFTLGRTYETDIMNLASTFNNINIYNCQVILRIILKKG